MSVEALAAVLHHSKASGTDKLVLLGIANHAGDGGAWPTVATLARYANTTERTVRRSLGKLVQLGELAVHRQAGGTSDRRPHERPNRYDVLVACPATCDRTPQHRVKPLPRAQAELWIDPLTPVSPPDASVTRGVTPVSPGGVTPASPKPSIEPHPLTSRTAVTSPRARETCDECGQDAETCIRRAATSGHTYRPRRRDHLAVVARVRDHYADVTDPTPPTDRARQA